MHVLLPQLRLPLLFRLLLILLLMVPKVLPLSTDSGGRVISLSRWAVKGLSADSLRSVRLSPGATFPNDRRWALLDLESRGASEWDATAPQWLHKENFVCAFTASELLSRYDTSFDDALGMLSVRRKAYHSGGGRREEPAILSESLHSVAGRDAISEFFSEATGKAVRVVTADAREHVHQFGNTGSGVKRNNDTRTIHLINAATVRELSEACGVAIEPERFRANVVIDGIAPWEEFSWVVGGGEEGGKKGALRIGSASLEVLSRTVRCDGVSDGTIDVPAALIEHFPEHGPYLGVYAQVRGEGDVSVGDACEY